MTHLTFEEARRAVEAQSTDLVRLTIVRDARELSGGDAEDARKACEEVQEAVYQAFSRPWYKLFAWVSEPAGEARKNELAGRMLRWVVQLCAWESYRRRGWVVAARDAKTNEMMGGALVVGLVRQPPGESALARAWRRLGEETGGIVAVMTRFGLPPPIRGVLWYGLRSLQRLMGVLALEEHRHIATEGVERYIYLQQIATHPEHQGKGVGKAVLAAVGALADASDAAAYLETDELHLRDFYSRNGWRVHHEYVIRGERGARFEPNFAMVRDRRGADAAASKGGVVEDEFKGRSVTRV